MSPRQDASGLADPATDRHPVHYNLTNISMDIYITLSAIVFPLKRLKIWQLIKSAFGDGFNMINLPTIF